MESYTIRDLTGNPDLDAAEIEDLNMTDAGIRPAGLPDSPDLEREMSEAFGYDVPPTDEQMEDDYAARRCDEAELVAKFPGIKDKSDAELIEVVATGDDEHAAAAASVLADRLGIG